MSDKGMSDKGMSDDENVRLWEWKMMRMSGSIKKCQMTRMSADKNVKWWECQMMRMSYSENVRWWNGIMVGI